MHQDLQAILLRDNPWLLDRERLGSWLGSHVPARFVLRRAMERAAPRWRDSHRAHLVIGPRQAGKSTMLWAYLASLDEPALFLDCEQALLRGVCRSAPLFLESLEGLVPELPALFFDEVQHLDEAGLFVKGLVDRRPGRPLFVTGSASFHLRARTRESLAGRATRTHLLSFSLAEVCQDFDGLGRLLQERGRAERFARHVRVGGYPDVWLADSPAPLLQDLIEAFVLRDASDLFRIARPDAFRQLMHLLAQQVGSLVNLSEWASICGVSRDTVGSYLRILEESHVITTLRPFRGRRRSELTSRPKVYLLDTGLRNHLVGDLRTLQERADRGSLLECWVLGELCKTLPTQAPVHFWRSTSGAEVDFVVPLPDRLVAIEVKAQAMRRPRLPRAARSFIDAYQPERLVLVNLELEHEEALGATRILWTRPWNLDAALGGLEPDSDG